ncbi:MAG: hypothetical protein FWF51_11075 [Chitinivibrionia bacterium]|nr:hypothetical protein [Chitinivibrionia bacterium]
MKIKIAAIVGVIGLFSFSIAFNARLRNDSAKRLPKTIIDAADVLPYLRDGDVICRLGDRGWSSFIRYLSSDDRRFSHIGIVRIRDENVSVINAECLVNGRNESVNEVSLSDYLELARAVGVYRANFLDGSIISDDAVKYLGYPFDWDFDFDDESKIYCTELLHVIIKNNAPEYGLATVNMSGINLAIIPTEAISKSADFDEIFCAGIWNEKK